MGGFLLNGCGAADTVKKLRLLKTEHCSTCGKMREFYLAKISMKIHVAFIPTIPLNTKYGIVCSKCKTGNYVTEEQMKQLMSADEESKAMLYDAIMHPGETGCDQPDPLHLTEQVQNKNTTDQLLSTVENRGNGATTCKLCGQPLAGNEAFCGYCGAPQKESASDSSAESRGTEKTPVESPPANLCPQCGSATDADAFFCGYCGAALKTHVVSEAKSIADVSIAELGTPEIHQPENEALNTSTSHVHAETKMWECPLCMTKNDANMDHCQLCGQVR